MSHRSFWAVLGTLVLAACSGEASGGQTQNAIEAGEHTVLIRLTDDMKFVPENPTISVGDTVIWINEGSMLHTSTDKPGTAGVDEHNILPDQAAPWDSGLLEPGQSYRRVFTVAGDYTYLCFLHEAAGMVGRLTVSSTLD